MFNKKKNNKGFTLVELLVVIAIMGILAVVAVPSLFKNINKAHAADAVSYISAYRTAVISEYTTTGDVPEEEDIEPLVESKPEKAISSVIINSEGKDLVVNFTMTNNEIAEAVKKQLGEEISNVSGNVVTVTIMAKDTTN